MKFASISYSTYFKQLFVWLLSIFITKASIIKLQQEFWEQFDSIAMTLLRLFGSRETVQLLFTVIFFPLFMVTFQYLIQDSFLKKHSFAREENIILQTFYIREIEEISLTSDSQDSSELLDL